MSEYLDEMGIGVCGGSVYIVMVLQVRLSLLGIDVFLHFTQGSAGPLCCSA